MCIYNKCAIFHIQLYLLFSLQVECPVNAQVEAQSHHSSNSNSNSNINSNIVNNVEAPAAEFSLAADVSVLAAEVDAGAATSGVSSHFDDTSTPSPALSSPVGGLPIIKVRIHQFS